MILRIFLSKFSEVFILSLSFNKFLLIEDLKCIADELSRFCITEKEKQYATYKQECKNGSWELSF